jgi:hypothetical protein
MEASHTESLAAHYFRSGKLVIQIVSGPFAAIKSFVDHGQRFTAF